MLVFSDIIDFVIILYVWCCLYMRSGIDEKAQTVYFTAGAALMTILAADQSWQIIYMTEGIPNHAQRQILNFITSVIYMIIPLCYFNLLRLGFNRWHTWKRRVSVLLMILFMAIPLCNIFHPVLFYHDRYMEMHYTALNTMLSVSETAYFTFLFLDFCRNNFPFDRKDHILVTFVILTICIGQAAELVEQDLSATWNSMTIAYLLMYLSIKELYDKTDSVTGLANRMVYRDRISWVKDERCTIVLFDMNYLKFFNDTRGHQSGDAYLRAFAQTLNAHLKSYGQVFRTGGDEFTLVSEADPDDVQKALEELSSQKLTDAEFGDFPLSFAYGMAVRSEDEPLNATELRADKQMYIMKKYMHKQIKKENQKKKMQEKIDRCADAEKCSADSNAADIERSRM